MRTLNELERDRNAFRDSEDRGKQSSSGQSVRGTSKQPERLHETKLIQLLVLSRVSPEVYQSRDY